jgi:hypothetical protein
VTIATRRASATRRAAPTRRFRRPGLRRLLIAAVLAALLLVLTAGAAFAPTAVEYAVMLVMPG